MDPILLYTGILKQEVDRSNRPDNSGYLGDLGA